MSYLRVWSLPPTPLLEARVLLWLLAGDDRGGPLRLDLEGCASGPFGQVAIGDGKALIGETSANAWEIGWGSRLGCPSAREIDARLGTNGATV